VEGLDKRKKKLKDYGSAMRNLKWKIRNTLSGGGAG
jgi:hypothetical protein